jgi:hypothetical protein
MIAIASKPKRPVQNPRWHNRFLKMLPAIRRYARFSFRNLPTETRDELVQETIANCCVACRRLAQRRKLAVALPSPLARFAVAQVRAGRRVCSSLNGREVLSDYAQRREGFRVERLDHCADDLGQWGHALVEDHHTPVDEQAAFRIDFPAWLARLAPRHRRMVKFLAAGNSTSEAARHFRMSAGRVSQLRNEFHRDWLRFHGELLLGHKFAVTVKGEAG